MTDIWVLFSIANEYDQPDNNLVAWWRDKPSFETLIKAMGGSFSDTVSILNCAKVYEGERAGPDNIDYRLEQITEGVIP